MKDKNKILFGIVEALMLVVALYFVSVFVNCFITRKTLNVFQETDIIFAPSTLGMMLLLCLVAGVAWMLKRLKDIDSKPEKPSGPKQFFDSKFLLERDLRRDKKFHYCTYDTLNTEKDGIIIRTQLKNKSRLEINFYENIHTMIIGTTGSGKTTRYVSPTIQILAKTKTKPSMVISDPKGELYTTHSKLLMDSGYEVKVLDLRYPYTSARWNPLSRAYKLYNRAFHLDDEIVAHNGVNPADLKLKITAPEYSQTWWEFDGYAYATPSALENDLLTKKQELVGDAFADLKDIAMVIAPIENQQDSSWDRGAQDFILGIMTAMLEDTQNSELGMTEEKFNFYNVNKIANFRDSDPDNKLVSLHDYFYERPTISNALGLANVVVNNSPRTADNYLGIVTTRLSLFNDQSMCYLTSGTDVNFDTVADKPTAFFIKIPDEKATRHPIATMAISQLYKSLVDRAAPLPSQRLPRNVHFILDEFGNLPKIQNMETIITVARSRGIFFHLVIQSYPQLNIKYGDATADTIKSNCNIQIFLATTDLKTKEDFSKRCGNITVKTQNKSESKSSGKGTEPSGKQTSYSYQESSRPLVYPDELEHLGKNIYIVSILNEFPIKAEFTPAYECPMFKMAPLPDFYVAKKYFDETKIYYDITQRNKIVKPKKEPPRGGFGGFNSF